LCWRRRAHIPCGDYRTRTWHRCGREVNNAIGFVDSGDAVIVDGTTGEVHIRPSPDLEASYIERVRVRARRQLQYQALRDKPCVTRDGVEISLFLNAGLLVDLPHIEETGASGIGLFRTNCSSWWRGSFRAPASSSRSTVRCWTLLVDVR